jgi:hypothetical protein
MATAGVSIVSAVVEEEGTLAAVETAAADIIPQPIVDAADRQYAAAAAAVGPMQRQRVAAPLMVRAMQRRRVVAPIMVAVDRMVVDRMVGDRMGAANTTSRSLADFGSARNQEGRSKAAPPLWISGQCRTSKECCAPALTPWNLDEWLAQHRHHVHSASSHATVRRSRLLLCASTIARMVRSACCGVTSNTAFFSIASRTFA